MLNAENWCIKVHDRVYGPYPSAVLRRYAREGRLAPWSMVAPAGGQQWQAAGKEPAFNGFFEELDDRDGPAEPRFGRRSDDTAAARAETARRRAEEEKAARAAEAARRAARPTRESVRSAAARRNGAANGPRRPKPLGAGAKKNAAGALSNFLLVFDIVSGAAAKAGNAVQQLGPAVRIEENVWSLTCASTANGVRNAIAPYLRPNESIFVVDATTGGVAWQNFAPQTHAKISELFAPRQRTA
ncbi:MAG: hypothetical protein ACFB00_13630 [Parvularculaceae bacterium]